MRYLIIATLIASSSLLSGCGSDKPFPPVIVAVSVDGYCCPQEYKQGYDVHENIQTPNKAKWHNMKG